MSNSTNSTNSRFEFGFLFLSEPITFDDVIITPVNDYLQNKRDVIENHMGAKQRFLYPPIRESVARQKSPKTSKYERVYGAKRPDHLWKLPASHELQLVGTPGDITDLRTGKGVVILYLLSFILKTRLHFTHWWIDGKIPIDRHEVVKSISALESFLSHACHTWETWTDNQKSLFINILYMNSRLEAYTWHWEQFLINYTVFDACYCLTHFLYLPKIPRFLGTQSLFHSG